MLDRFGREAMSPGEHRQLFGMLFGEVAVTEFSNLKALNSAARKNTSVRGPVVGGNLTVLQSGLGTPASLRGGKHILFLFSTSAFFFLSVPIEFSVAVFP